MILTSYQNINLWNSSYILLQKDLNWKPETLSGIFERKVILSNLCSRGSLIGRDSQKYFAFWQFCKYKSKIPIKKRHQFIRRVIHCKFSFGRYSCNWMVINFFSVSESSQCKHPKSAKIGNCSNIQTLISSRLLAWCSPSEVFQEILIGKKQKLFTSLYQSCGVHKTTIPINFFGLSGYSKPNILLAKCFVSCNKILIG